MKTRKDPVAKKKAPSKEVVSAWAMKVRIYPKKDQETRLGNGLYVRHRFRNEAVSYLKEPLKHRNCLRHLDPSSMTLVKGVQWRDANDVSQWLTERLGKAKKALQGHVDYKLHDRNIRSTLAQWSQGERDEVEDAWLLTVQRTVLDQVVRDLSKTVDKAIKDRVNGISKPAGFPKHHKFSFASSFRMQVVASKNKEVKTHWEAGEIYLPDIGRLRFRDELKLPTSCPALITISRNPCGQWFASFFVKEHEHPKAQEKSFAVLTQTPLPLDEHGLPKVLALDGGIKHIATDDTGKKHENSRHLKRYHRHRAHAQRNLSRKKKGSGRWKSQRNYLATIETRITNCREESLRKIAKEVVDNAAIICLEDLALRNMMKNHSVAGALADTSLGRLYALIEMRARREGKLVLRCGRFDPTSQLCSTPDCDYRNRELKLSDRTWTCPGCGTNHDRDINAAINIRLLALSSETNQKAAGCAALEGLLHPQLASFIVRGGMKQLLASARGIPVKRKFLPPVNSMSGTSS